MGLDYGYSIICRKEQLWSLLQNAAEISAPDFRQGTAELETKQGNSIVSLSSLWGKELIFEGQAVKELRIETALFFAVDEHITREMGELPLDAQGRVALGVIYIHVETPAAYEPDEDISEEWIDADDVLVQFRAPTSRMSLMFEVSPSIRDVFLRLAQSHENSICYLNREGSDIMLWMEGQSVIEVIEDSWRPRANLREQVRANEIARELRHRAEHAFAADVFAEAVADSDALRRAVAIRELGSKSQVNRDLLAHILTSDSDVRVRQCAAQAIGQCRYVAYSAAMQALTAALTDSAKDVRIAACHALSKVAFNDAFPQQMLSILSDESKEVRQTAAGLLAPGQWSRRPVYSSEFVQKLIEALQDSAAASSIAWLLGRIRALEAVEPLCQMLKPTAPVWKDDFAYKSSVDSIARALGEIGDPRAVPALAHLLENGECMGRSSAASALGELGDARAIKPLTRALQDDDHATKYNAARSLKRIEALMQTDF